MPQWLPRGSESTATRDEGTEGFQHSWRPKAGTPPERTRNPNFTLGDAATRFSSQIPLNPRGHVCMLSHFSFVRLCNPVDAACQAFLSFTISRRLLKLMSIESVMPSNHLILCCPVLLLPSIFPSIRIFSNELALHMR